jgi:membrane protein
VQEISPESPEQRAQDPSRWEKSFAHVRPGSQFFTVVRRVAIGVYSDGFIHAGNLAYLALLTLFPFFIVTAALAQFFGRGPDAMIAVASFLHTLPPSVADLLRKPIHDVLAQRTGSLLWLGALAGLWSVGSFIETIRDILRRAYGTTHSLAFWRYRLGSIVIIIASVILALTAFSAQVLITGAEAFISRLLPQFAGLGLWVGLSRIAPLIMLAVALYAIFYTLTPSKYRFARDCPKWPGPVFTTIWWITATMALPPILSRLTNYNLTYGSLAGTIIALLFFWLVGLGLVIGAHLNAALAEMPPSEIKDVASEPAQA